MCEYPDFTNETQPTARKEHICDECNRPIRIGRKYSRYTGKWDGSISTFTMHLGCMEALNYWSQSASDCVAIGETRNDMFGSYTREEQMRDEDMRGVRASLAKGLWESRL